MGMRSFRFRRGEKGAAIVEFALVAPILFVIVFGIIEFGMAFWRKQQMTTAVRDAARYGMVKSSPKHTASEIQDKVTEYLKNAGWDTGRLSATATGAAGASGTDLTVKATYPTSFVILSKFKYGGMKEAVNGSGDVTLTATVTVQHE